MTSQSPASIPRRNHAKGAAICAITMIKDDYFFLEKWIDYYSRQIGASNLIVISHGCDPLVAQIAKNVTVIPAPQRIDDSIGHQKFEVDRFNLINNVCNGLVRYFDALLFVDVDEFIVVDPRRGQTISEYVKSYPNVSTFTALGLDVFHKRSIAPEKITSAKPILTQRFTVKLESLYSKPAISRREIVRSVGNHNANDPTLFVAPDLYLFHLKWMDIDLSMNMHLNRFLARSNTSYKRGSDLLDVGHDFPLRAKIAETFDEYESLPLSSRNFEFDEIREKYRQSWRRRRFLLQKSFYRSLLSKRAPPFSMHWRFDLIRPNEYHEIPQRFRSAL